MSASGWGAPDWRAGEGERERLPDIEDLPIAERGYDQEAVREAFDRFYRHAAQLDSTLRVLESVEAFSAQARELRSDIRSLRAASWGPAPSARHVWSVGHEAWAPEEPPAALAASLPRLALWAVLIVAVGVGAALADLRTLVIVALVLGAWLLVGLIELVIASSRAARIHAPLAPHGPAAVAEPAPAAVPAPAHSVASPQETMISAPTPVPVAEEAAEPAPEEPAREEPAAEEAAVAAPEVAAEPAHEEAPEAAAEEPAAPASVEPAPVVEAPLVLGEEEAVASEAEAVEPVAAVPAEAPLRRGFFRRRREPVSVEDTDPQLGVADLAPAGWRPEEAHVDPWERDADANGEPAEPAEPAEPDAADERDEPLEAAAPPARGLLRRGRR